MLNRADKDDFETGGRNPASKFRIAAGALSLLLVSGLIVTTSRAAFTNATDNTGNSFTAGTVDLVDDDLGATGSR